MLIEQNDFMIIRKALISTSGNEIITECPKSVVTSGYYFNEAPSHLLFHCTAKRPF